MAVLVNLVDFSILLFLTIHLILFVSFLMLLLFCSLDFYSLLLFFPLPSSFVHWSWWGVCLLYWLLYLHSCSSCSVPFIISHSFSLSSTFSLSSISCLLELVGRVTSFLAFLSTPSCSSWSVAHLVTLFHCSSHLSTFQTLMSVSSVSFPSNTKILTLSATLKHFPYSSSASDFKHFLTLARVAVSCGSLVCGVYRVPGCRV